jgi:hypothetical protein
MTSPNSLKVILNSSNGVGTDYSKTFQPLTQQNDILYNEFFNHIRKNNIPIKIVLTGCCTTCLDYRLIQPDQGAYVPLNKDPYYVSVQIDGVTAKNEIAPNRSIEFIVPTMISYNTRTITIDAHGLTETYIEAKPVVVQWLNLPKSNHNLGIELNDYSIFTSPLQVNILDNNKTVVTNDTSQGYRPHFTIEFWIFYES